MTTAALPRQRLEWWTFVLAVFPLALAIVLSLYLRPHAPFERIFNSQFLQPVKTNGARDLGVLFSGLEYAWPPADHVPPLGLRQLPDDMATLPVDTKKQLFFQALLPLVLAENARIAKQRAFVQAQFAHDGLDPGSPAWAALNRLAGHYNIVKSLEEPTARKTLLRRLDTVPPALVLAQAAKESGWGTSRFALEANNLFGVWTWDADAGLAPRRAAADAGHYVRIFPSLRASVRNYLYNINVGHAFLALRQMRARLRAAGKTPTALQLAQALENYSANGARYVDAIDGLIRYNELTALGKLNLRLTPLREMARE